MGQPLPQSIRRRGKLGLLRCDNYFALCLGGVEGWGSAGLGGLNRDLQVDTVLRLGNWYVGWRDAEVAHLEVRVGDAGEIATGATRLDSPLGRLADTVDGQGTLERHRCFLALYIVRGKTRNRLRDELGRGEASGLQDVLTHEVVAQVLIRLERSEVHAEGGFLAGDEALVIEDELALDLAGRADRVAGDGQA